MGKSKTEILVQDRDFEVLRFCLEMRFADIESLSEKFFVAKSQELFAARKRISKLESSGLLRSVALQSGKTKKFYLATPKGHREMFKLSGPSAKDVLGFSVLKPVKKLSVVTFEHDLGVLKSRMLLEKQGRASNWRSERLLKAQAESYTGRLARDFMPDGLFTSKQGKVCAFEFENKPKTEAQLKEKVYRLNAIMNQAEPVFEAVLFITSTEHLKKKIKTITDVAPKKFVVQSFAELQGFNNERGDYVERS